MKLKVGGVGGGEGVFQRGMTELSKKKWKEIKGFSNNRKPKQSNDKSFFFSKVSQTICKDISHATSNSIHFL